MLTNPGGLNDLTGAIIDAAIAVHKETGPGLLEGVYTECSRTSWDIGDSKSKEG